VIHLPSVAMGESRFSHADLLRPDASPGLDDLYGVARELDAEDRAVFLANLRDTDSQLADELSELLGHAEAAETFFERLGREVGALRASGRAMALRRGGMALSSTAAEDLPPGTEVGPYRILERIGSGGMGAVYRARDPRLDREVALKFLSPRLATDPRARERFLEEARAAAGLDHRNICTVHEVGESSEGRPFIAMAHYEGETLKERIDRGPLPVEEAVQLTTSIASALDLAHRRGIVHRDVKPGNVMLTEDGGVKLLDFGLAKAADAELTRPGRAPGTVAYMAPEHLRGEPVDGRADLWSLGVVFHEMLTGARPFHGGAERAVVRAILESEPPSLQALRPDVPEHVAGAVERLLRKDRAERHASAEELLEDLGSEIVEPVSDGLRFPPWRRTGLGFLVAAALVTVAAIFGWPFGPGAGSSLDDGRVAVLPFRVAGADPSLSYLRDGMLDLFTTKLRGGRGLRPVDQRALTGLLERRLDGRDPVPEEALAAAADLGAGRLILGEVVSLPDRVVLTASLWHVDDRRAEPPVSVEGPVDSLAVLVDRLVGGVLSVEAGEGDRLASLTTDSLEALRHFLAGQAAYRRGHYDSAARSFVRAYDIDTAFALAALMGWGATRRVGGATAPTRVTYLDAWRHRDRLGARDREFLELFVGPRRPDVYSSREVLLASRRELVRRQPDRAEAWMALALWIPHAEGPYVPGDSVVLTRTYEAFGRALEADRDFLPALEWLHFTALALGDGRAAEAHAERFLSKSPTGLAAETIRCVRAALDSTASFEEDVVARVDSGGADLAGRCVATLYNLGTLRTSTAVSEARDALAAHLTRRLGDEPGLLRVAGDVLSVIAHDGGRPAEAARIEEARVRAGYVDSLSYLTAHVRNGLWWGGERRTAKDAAHLLASQLERMGSESFGAREADVLCALGQWWLASDREEDVSPMLGRLRTLAGHGRTSAEVDAGYCADLLTAWHALEEQETAVADSLVDRLSAPDARRPLAGRLLQEGNLILAHLLERRGDPRRAIDALRRDRFSLPIYLSTQLRERGRLAASIGDTVEAVDAFERYLALRTDPSPPVADDVARVRETLQGLTGEWR